VLIVDDLRIDPIEPLVRNGSPSRRRKSCRRCSASNSGSSSWSKAGRSSTSSSVTAKRSPCWRASAISSARSRALLM
jgi:hypothetical protein